MKVTKETVLNKEISIRKILFVLCMVLSTTSWISNPLALVFGLIVSLLMGNPFSKINYKLTQVLLQFSVVGLGFGVNINNAVQAGREGFLYTLTSIIFTILFGILLGKWFKVEEKISHLITSGTAICGGSAIAAMAPVIKAEEKQISVALGTVFILNSAALFIFPAVGSRLHLTQQQFGLWCAIAIHDTSSVVGAAGKFGSHALEIATTVKLARSLWIIPLTFIYSFVFKTESKKIKMPYFIGYFVLAMICGTYIPAVRHIARPIVSMANMGLKVTLFLIGAGLSVTTLKLIGVKPLLQGFLLWLGISVIALLAILYIY